jgi:hypothetical protein
MWRYAFQNALRVDSLLVVIIFRYPVGSCNGVIPIGDIGSDTELLRRL